MTTMPPSEAAAAYLRRLGVDGDLPPTLETLVALHRAHLDAVPYENLGIMLGRPPSVDPARAWRGSAPWAGPATASTRTARSAACSASSASR